MIRAANGLAGSWLVAALVAGVLPRAAAAHHASPVARPAGPTSALGLGRFAPVAPSLQTSVKTSLSYFGRFKRGEAVDDAEGEVMVGTLTPAAAVGLQSGTRAVLELPVGFVRAEAPEAPEQTSFGLGDLTLAVSQDLARLWSAPSAVFFLRLRGGLTAPTGRYEREAAVSFTETTRPGLGALERRTYNTQASLGAGVWAASAGLQAGWMPHRRWALGAALQVTAPLDRTPDDIGWGRDLDGQVAVGFVPWLDTLHVSWGLDYRWHDEDSVADPVLGRVEVGGRHEIGMAAGLAWSWSRQLTCTTRLHLPIWQQVGGIQLVETVAAEVGCGYVFSL